MATEINVKPSGPYVVSGPVTLVDPTGKTIAIEEGKIVALCRCGQSAAKPYCDGAHGRVEFQATDPAPER